MSMAPLPGCRLRICRHARFRRRRDAPSRRHIACTAHASITAGLRIACAWHASVISGRRIACAWHASLFDRLLNLMQLQVARCFCRCPLDSEANIRFGNPRPSRVCAQPPALFCVCMMTRIGSHTVAVRPPSEADSFTVPFACRRL